MTSSDKQDLENKDFYKNILDGIINGVWVTNANNIIYYTNKGMEKIAGIPAKQLVGTHVLKDFPESTLKYFRPHYLKAEETLKPVFYDAVSVLTPEGRQSYQSGWLIPKIKEGKYDGIICTVDNITERKTAELKLKESEENLRKLNIVLEQRINERTKEIMKFKTVSDNANYGIGMIDLNGNLIYNNEYFATIHGYKTNELIGKDFTIFHNKEQLKRVLELKLKLEKEGSYNAQLVWHKHKDGTNFPMLMNGVYIKDKSGNPLLMAATAIDFTERKKIEYELQQNKQRLELAIKSGNLGIWDRDILTGKVIRNERTAEIYGYSLEEMEGHIEWWQSRIHPEDRPKVLEQRNRHLDGLVPFYKAEYRLQHRSGEWRWIMSRGKVVERDKDGNALRIVGTLNDITELKKIESKLKKSEEKYKNLSNETEMILDHIPGLIFYKDTKNNFIRVNKLIADAHHMTKEELTGKDLFDLYPKEVAQAYWEDDLKVIKSKKPSLNIEEPWDTLEGRKWVSTSKIPYLDEEGKISGIIGFSNDITERKKTEQKLKESEEKYREAYNLANFYKDLFAHDMNNILQSIVSTAEFHSFFRNDPEKLKDFGDISELVKMHVRRGSSLISKVRTLSRLEESEINLRPIGVFEVLNKAVQNAEKSFHDKNINIKTEGLSKDLKIIGGYLLIDIFDNLLHNAVKFSDADKECIVDIIISKIQADNINYIKFEFKDQGSGIPDDRKEFLFKRISDKSKTKRGMGIGLSLVKKIVDKYESKIWVEDRIKGKYEEGCNFVLLLKEAP